MSKRIALRLCIGCGERKPKDAMIRIVRTPEGDIRADGTGKEPGRGAYVCRNAECVRLACAKHGPERSFRTRLSKEVREELQREMEEIVSRQMACDIEPGSESREDRQRRVRG